MPINKIGFEDAETGIVKCMDGPFHLLNCNGTINEQAGYVQVTLEVFPDYTEHFYRRTLVFESQFYI